MTARPRSRRASEACTTSQPVPLLDIRDAEAFVRSHIPRTMQLSEHEREDLVGDGLVILYELAARYDPAKDTGAQASFGTWAHYLLPRKLSDAWHKANPHHRLQTNSEGKRTWVYYQPADPLTGPDGQDHRDHPHIRTPGNFIPAPTA